MSVLSDLASGLTVATIPLLHFTIGLEFWQLLMLVFAGALLDAPGQTARRSFVPELAQAAGSPLATANGYFGAINRSTVLIGPLIAGVFIAGFGAAPLLWIDAGTFAISAALMLLFVPSGLEPATEPRNAGGSYRSDLIDGFKWIIRNRLIRTLVIMFMITNLIEAPIVIVLTVYAREVLDSSIAFGIQLGVFSVAAIAGSMISGAISARIPGRLMFPLAFGGISALYVAMILQPPFMLLLVGSFIAGLAAGPINPFLDTVFQQRVPQRMRGRVFGLRSAIMMAATPLGILTGGALIEATGLRTTLTIQLVALLIVVLWMVLSPALREVDQEKTPE